LESKYINILDICGILGPQKVEFVDNALNI